NDGTRLYTPTAVGPDGGSTPTNVAPNEASATDIDDDQESTTPSEVPDSGAIAAGGTTLDDTLSAGTSGPATTAETRISGFGVFSSGFGSRVNLSAPSDNVLAFEHPQYGDADTVDVTLNGGTSAAAPEVAAAAAVALQAARLSGHSLSPLQVRALLERTGRAVPTPAQIDQPLHVGPQVDVTAAVEAELGARATKNGVSIARLSVAHHVTVGDLGGQFTETTDPDFIDLGDVASGGDGEGLVGPVTIAGDVVGLPAGGARVQYRLTEGATVWASGNPAIRVTPKQLLAAAKLPVVSTSDRTVSLTYSVVVDGRVAASQAHTLTIGPSNGQYAEATAPVAPATVALGHSVTVSYDIADVTGVSDPELVVSTAGHWNPALAPIFSAAWSVKLKPGTAGKVTIPASAFDDGGAIYGIGVLQAPVNGVPETEYDYGEFAPIRVVGGSAAQRPSTPVLTGEGVTGHSESIDRAQPGFGVRYDVRDVPGAASTLVEFSAPAPSVYSSYNTFVNANGTQIDHDGVDAGSTAHVKLSGTAGTAQLNGLKIGLPTSETYDVRVFALDRAGHIIGQASPISSLEFDDGLAPNGASVRSFAAAGPDSVAALEEPDGSSQVVHYDTATGEYGSVIAQDSTAGSDYEVLGVDAVQQRALLVHQTSATSPTTLETWNLGTDTLV
ncbi:MAG TPA: S8 family serine peptidase, partial [Acidimicrobiales bacterium]